jgi:hypothetical protein
MNKMKAGSATVDSRATSVVAGAALVILTIAYGAPLLSAVGTETDCRRVRHRARLDVGGLPKALRPLWRRRRRARGLCERARAAECDTRCPVGDGGGLRRRRDVEHRSCCSALPAAACFKWQFALSVNLLLVVS